MKNTTDYKANNKNKHEFHIVRNPTNELDDNQRNHLKDLLNKTFSKYFNNDK